MSQAEAICLLPHDTVESFESPLSLGLHERVIAALATPAGELSRNCRCVCMRPVAPVPGVLPDAASYCCVFNSGMRSLWW